MGELSTNQYVSFVLVFVFSSLLSLVGSSLLIFLVLKDLKRVYHRTLMMISIGDIFFSISNLVHLFWLPENKTDSPYAIGNDMTCSLVGFCLNAALLFVSIQNSFISANFYLQIRFRWTDVQIARFFEPFINVLSVCTALIVPGIGVVVDGMSPSYESGLCLMTPYPRGCMDDDSEVQCERGVFSATYLAPTVSGLIYFFGLTGFYCTFALYWTVRSSIAESKRNASPGEFQTNDLRQQERMSRVSRQCTLYALAYLNTIIWPAAIQVVFRAMDAEGRRGDPGLYTLRIVALLCFPLQGCLNFIVFIAPKYQMWRQALPDEPWTYVLRQVLLNKTVPSARSQILLTPMPRRPDNASNMHNNRSRPESKKPHTDDTHKFRNTTGSNNNGPATPTPSGAIHIGDDRSQDDLLPREREEQVRNIPTQSSQLRPPMSAPAPRQRDAAVSSYASSIYSSYELNLED